MRLQSIKSKLLLSFTIFVLLVASIITTFLWSQFRNSKISKVNKAVTDIDVLVKDIHILENDFFHYETINPQFYKTGKSQLVVDHHNKIGKLKNEFEKLRKIREIQSSSLDKEVKEVENLISRADVTFKSIVEKIAIKGFKDYGLIGKMRKHIHGIESAEKQFRLDLAKILMIRRYEKDFLLRKDDRYLAKLTGAVELLKADIKGKIFNPATRDSIVGLVDAYQANFAEMVKVDKEVGVENTSGLKHQLALMLKTLSQNIRQISGELSIASDSLARNVRTTLLIITGVFLVLIIVLIYVVIRQLSNPIRDLSESINNVIEQNFTEDTEIIEIQSKDEIGKLSRDFKLMLDKVKERADEVTQQYENIKLLTDVGKEITANLLIEKIVEVVHENMKPLLDAPVFSIGVYDDEAKKLDFIGKHESKMIFGYDSLDDETKLSVWCFNNKKKILINDFSTEASNYVSAVSLPENIDQKPESAIYLPLIVKDQVVGVMTAQSYHKNAYTDYHLNLLQNFSVYTAIALFNAKVYRHIERQNQNLQLSEERIRQTAEELQTMNEELESSRVELVGQISAIKRTLAVAEFDREGNVIEANTLFLNELEYERADLLGKHHTVLLDDEIQNSDEYQMLWEKLKKGIPQKVQLEFRSRFKKTIILNSTYTPVVDQNNELKKIIKLSTLLNNNHHLQNNNHH
ncbi:hypothetical protein BKI52_10940 [marine bacterium AO1-C]|nr:hypothetical protein BKI52_10940 [marine bacterium AO1-C]